MPLPIVAGLTLFRCIDTEQPHELGTELHRIAVDDLEARLCARRNNVVVGLRVRREGNDEANRPSRHMPLPSVALAPKTTPIVGASPAQVDFTVPPAA
jgi:hypothetical protein